MKDAEFDVSGFSSATLDYICVVPKLGNHKEVTFIDEIRFLGGGCVPTAFVALQRLGASTAFLSALGDDWVGDQIIKGLEEENVYVDKSQIIKGYKSPFSFIQVNKKTGNRAISFYPGSSKMLRFDDHCKDIIARSRMLHLALLMPKEEIKAAKFAKSMGIPVMLDADKFLEGTHALLQEVDYLITSTHFLKGYTKTDDEEEALRKLHQEYAHKILVSTLGKRGSITIVNKKIRRVETFNDVKVIDSTGAGDVYHGAFIFGLLHKWDIIDIMIFASAVSSMKCMAFGGRAAIPDYKKTIDFLKERNIDISKYILRK